MFSKMFSRFTRKRTPTKSKTSTQKSPMRVVHVEEPVPTLPEALNTTHETIANLKEEKVKIENKLSAHEVILNRAQAEFDNANDRNREQKRTTLNLVVKIKKMLTNNLHHINVQISKFETMVETMDSMAQHLKNVEDEALKSRAGKRKLRNKTKGGMFSIFRKNSTGTKKRGIFSMFSRTKTPSTRMSTNTLTPKEEADVDVAREIAKLEEEEKLQQYLKRLQQDLKNQQLDLEREQKVVERQQKDAERQYREMLSAMKSGAPNFGTDAQLLEELENLKLENLAGTRKKRKLKKHKKKH